MPLGESSLIHALRQRLDSCHYRDRFAGRHFAVWGDLTETVFRWAAL